MRRVVVLSLALAACQPHKPAAPDPAPAPPAAAEPAGSVMDLSRPLTAIGTEPFWSLSIDGTRLVLTRPDRPDLAAEAPGAKMTGAEARLEATAANGQVITVILRSAPCSDGMSDRSYPMSAEVDLISEHLIGCAGPTAEIRKSRP